MVPDRRTLTVLSTLMAGMTIISALLLLLEPGPVASLSGISLQQIEHPHSDPVELLFATDQPVGDQWHGIIIHDSGTLEGSAESLDRLHQQRGLGGLGYHFVINNGRGGRDGQIEMGHRWNAQLPGNYVQGEQAEQTNAHYIGIVVIGDADRGGMTEAQLRELVWLVQSLQRHLNIPRQGVYADLGDDPRLRAETFPYLWFREQLLAADLP